MNLLNEIICGDSLEVLKTLDSESIDCCITSPPYFAFKDYGDDPKNIENFKTFKEYLSYLEKIIKELKRVIRPDGRICFNIDDKHTNLKTEGENINRGTHAHLIMFYQKYGFEYKDIIIWAKARAGHASGGANYILGSYPYPPNIPLINWFEYILIGRKKGKSRVGNISTENKEKSKLGFEEFKWASQSIWYIPSEKQDLHICPFPIDIPARLIRLFSFVGDIILDPFMGSGTTGMAAKCLNRNYLGIELNPAYIKIANKRLAQQILF